jgi:hypothetical protein
MEQSSLVHPLVESCPTQGTDRSTELHPAGMLLVATRALGPPPLHFHNISLNLLSRKLNYSTSILFSREEAMLNLSEKGVVLRSGVDFSAAANNNRGSTGKI